MSNFEAALDLIRRGFAITPVTFRTKKPSLGDEWQKYEITESNLPQYFNGAQQNLGAKLGCGKASPTDLDLDCPEAIAAAPYLLPKTATFGHASKRASHWIYKTNLAATQDRAAIKILNTDKAGILEIRMGGGGKAAMTVFPPSIHISGEPILWENGIDQILEIDGDELLKFALQLGAASQLAQVYPKAGGRHDGSLVLGGFLKRCGLEVPRIKLFIEALAVASGQPGDKRHDMIRTAKDGAECATPAGFPLMVETFGEAATKKVADWLGYQGERSAGNVVRFEARAMMRKGANGLDDAPYVEGEHDTDLGNARRLVRFFGADIRYVSQFRAWYIWEGHRWRHDEDGEILRIAKAAIEKFFQGTAKITDDDIRKSARKFALASQSRSRLWDMVKLAESELPVVLSHKQLDADPMLLGVKNGVIELETGTFRKGKHEDCITKQCEVSYDKHATCPEWLKFQAMITDGNKDLIAYKQRVAGALLTGNVIEILFIPWGCGSNGKSTELETYAAILGDYGHASDASLLLARKETAGATPEIIALKGKRAIFINETPERARLNESRVKYLTGNDTLYGRGLNQDPINFKPSHKIILRTNHKPIIRGTDRGIWRRIHLIPYTKTIEGGDADFRQRKLIPELPGILNWMLDGLKAYLHEGLNPPKAVCDAIDGYRADMDLFGQWLAERCWLDRDLETKPSKPSRTLLKKLTADFNAWAKDDITRPWPNAAVSEKLKELGFEKAALNQGTVFAGITLKADVEAFDFDRKRNE
jgi:P4 family phage/plasmid primase-like protien